MSSQEASQPPAASYTGSPKYVEDDSPQARHDEEKGGSSIDTSDTASPPSEPRNNMYFLRLALPLVSLAGSLVSALPAPEKR